MVANMRPIESCCPPVLTISGILPFFHLSNLIGFSTIRAMFTDQVFMETQQKEIVLNGVTNEGLILLSVVFLE